VLACGIWLTPAGVFDRAFVRSLGPALAAGLTMVAVARALHTISSFGAAPIAVGAYVLCLWVTGGVDPRFVAELRRLFTSRVSRLRR
jgi:hypothetical protein